MLSIKPRQLAKILARLGFLLDRQRGSHAIWQHPDGRMTVVPMHPRDIPSGTLRGILNDIQIGIEELSK